MTNPDTQGVVSIDTNEDGNAEVTVGIDGDQAEVSIDIDSDGNPEADIKGNTLTVVLWVAGIALVLGVAFGFSYYMGWI
jgi:hypothetical protein